MASGAYIDEDSRNKLLQLEDKGKLTKDKGEQLNLNKKYLK